MSAFAMAAQGAPPTDFWIWTSLCAALAVAGFVATFFLLRKARLLEDTPPSRIRSAAQGYVELQGHARLIPGPEIRSPLSRQRCAWWRYTIEERRDQHMGGKRKSDWVTVESATSDEIFQLADPTGDCIIDPHGADVKASLKRSWYGNALRPVMIPAKTPWFSFGKYRYREEQVLVGDSLYILGYFRTQSAMQEYKEQDDVRELLSAWKKDERELLERFDADKDGKIDMTEWEAVRRAAMEKVRAQHVEHSLHPDISVVSKPPDRRPFLLSTLSQDMLVRRYRVMALFALLGFFCASVTAVTLLRARGIL